jgi:hypothetical protein
MRTKALLCAAGMLAAAATSMAQSNVYSLNVVGYINIPYTNGFQMVANQLHSDSTGTNNTVGGVFGTNLPTGTQVYGFSTTSGYATATLIANGTWTGGQPVVNESLSAGRGVWLRIPGASGTGGNVTIVGEVKQGTTGVPIATGFQISSLVPPLSTTIKTAMGYPAGTGDRVFQFSNATGYLPTRTYLASGSWTPTEPTPAVGESFWISRAAANGATTWNQTYNVP